MTDDPRTPVSSDEAFARTIKARATRKLKARRHATPGVWFGLGMMGLVG